MQPSGNNQPVSCSTSPLRRYVGGLFNGAPVAGPPYTIGVLPGEGIGPEVMDATLTVLRAAQSASATQFNVRTGGPIGLESVRTCGQAFSVDVAEFCRDVFAAGGAILAGPGGGRFVYDMRRHFDLYCKISPLISRPELRNACRLKPAHTTNIDILVVRENVAGIYQGRWSESVETPHQRTAFHTFSYSQAQVQRILRTAAAIAQQRRGKLTLIVKPSGMPTISKLWDDCAREVMRDYPLCTRSLEIDNAAYQLIQEPQQFDVIVSSNMFGDILSDVGGVLLGSRGLCYGGSFSAERAAVYQTNHGAAHDLASTDRANPVGQVFSLAMMLRESFGLATAADLIEAAVRNVWRQGWRTEDLKEQACRIVGTREMANRIAEEVQALGLREARSHVKESSHG